MGIMDFIEEAAGALAADKALEAVDPNAELLAKGAAAIAGFKGVEALKEHLAADGDDGQDSGNGLAGDDTQIAEDSDGDAASA